MNVNAMETRPALLRNEQAIISNTSDNCGEDEEGRNSSSIQQMSLHDFDKAQLSEKASEETEKTLHGDEQIDLPKEEYVNSSIQQSHQSLHNISFKLAHEDTSEETLPEITYLPDWDSIMDLNECHETEETDDSDIYKDLDISIYKDIYTPTSSDSSSSEEFPSLEIGEYPSDEGGEIEILSVTQIDDREPCQDHVAEKNMYCETCAMKLYTENVILIHEAKYMCFDCEQYICPECAVEHSDHLTVGVDEYENETDHHIDEMVDSLLLEDDDERQREIAEERYSVCGEIDIRTSSRALLPETCIIIGVCISKDGKLLVVSDGFNHSVKVFNMYNHKMVQCIRFSSSPHGVTEIPRHLIQEHFAGYIDDLVKDSSHTYIAVTFPEENKILIIDFAKNHARIVYTFRISGASGCREVFLFNGHLVTYCANYGPAEHKIKLLTMKGREVWTLDILNLPGHRFTYTFKAFHIAVHEESETIFICSPCNVSIVCVDIRGFVIETGSSTDIDIVPGRIHVDSDRNVFVSTYSSGVYKTTDHLKEVQVYNTIPLIVSNNLGHVSILLGMGNSLV